MGTELPHDVFRAVSDGTRREILGLLSDGEKTVSSLGESFAISQPALSQHLRVLRGAGLVSTRRAGRFRYYQLEPERLREIHDWVAYYERFWTERLDRLGEYLDKEQNDEA